MKTEIRSDKNEKWLVLTPETIEEDDALEAIESRKLGVRYEPVGAPLHICISVPELVEQEVHEEKP